ncbi:MAG: hypothetical protein CL431_02585 [Acidimicrobiaceae bacterium]|nr:hypothetical protein [Acidimicrobiaceae bacterium]
MTTKQAHGSGDSAPSIVGDTTSFPSDAELSRTLVASSGTGTLSTLTSEGYPYGSIVSYIHDDEGNPVILISDMAEHTINARNDQRASMLISEPSGEGDPLGKARLTLVGTLHLLDNPTAEREEYLTKHKHASFYVDYVDFNFWKLIVKECRYVGGFGHMSWVQNKEYQSAEIDPLFLSAQGIVDHMNDDHLDANLLYVKNLANLNDCSEAEMLGIDRYGVTLRASTSKGPRMVRIGFPSPIKSEEEARPAVIELLQVAKNINTQQLEPGE